MEKVMVTGATGYIGLHCIDQLLNKAMQLTDLLDLLKEKRKFFRLFKRIVLLPNI